MGLHLAIGLAGAGRGRLQLPGIAAAGFIAGSALPDLDFAILIPLYWVDRDLALSYHRAFSHSFVFIGMLGVAAAALAVFRGTRSSGHFLAAASAGALLHSLLDVLMWFEPVRLLWPSPTGFNIVGSLPVPEVAWNVVFAMECACYALFLGVLWRRVGTVPSVGWRGLRWLLVAVSCALLCLAPFVSRRTMEPLAYAPAIVIGFTVSVVAILKHRQALFSKPQRR
jgi:membrane-bound metal-dependent hydrolase YbcI (DUF457 family)